MKLIETKFLRMNKKYYPRQAKIFSSLFEKIFSYFFRSNSSIKNYYNIFHIAPIFLFSICSIPGAIIGLKKLRIQKLSIYFY